ncbi:MerR family transcriptional regulator [Microbulbifer echini]|uniref:MerR family transcriptional regulator n=1 Tax=Microbulbifer echini TaxID=1529067 RepID=A0ABV4NLI9_9GAMM
MIEIESPLEAHLPIREVARRTGVHPVTLRAWERRYGLLTPARTHKGHRLYTEEEVLRIEEVLDCLARGVAIGQVRELLERAPDSPLRKENATDTENNWGEMLDETCVLLQSFAEPQLRQRLDQWIAAFPAPLLLEHWLKPLQAKLARPRQSEKGVAQSFFWQVLNEQLLFANGIARKNLRKDQLSGAGRLLLLGFSGDDQRAFTQLFGAALLAAGIGIVVLDYRAATAGLEDIVEKLEVRGVLCYSHRALPKPFLSRELPGLARGLGKPLWLAGDCVEMQHADLDNLKKQPTSSILQGTTSCVITQLREQLK